MTLIDMSHLVFRMLHVSISEAKPRKKDKKYVTEDFKDIFVFLIMRQLIHVRRTFNSYGDVVICLDNSSKSYWRKEVCPLYKDGRAKDREESDINFTEVFEVINDLLTEIKEHFPFKVLEVEGAEADDIICVLSKTYSANNHKVLIYSEDKDFFQQLKHDNVDFYRPVAKKWITREDKPLDKWLQEHVCLGDEADNVFKIVDRIWFSENFKLHLKNFGLEFEDQLQFDIHLDPNPELKENILSSFTLEKTNRKGEPTGKLDIYKDVRFGESNLKREIEKHGSLDLWLDSHPYLRKNYEKNKILVLEEYIPKHIEDAIHETFNQPKQDYSLKDIENLFRKYNLNKLIPDINILVSGFQAKELISAADFGWTDEW